MALKWPAIAIAAALALVFASGSPAAAQQKKAVASDKRSACISKAQAENPNRADGAARQAAFKRCMGGG